MDKKTKQALTAIAIAASLGSAAAYATTPIVVKVDDDMLRMIPQKYSYEGSTTFYTENDNSLTLYNGDFENSGNINAPSGRELQCGYSTSYKECLYAKLDYKFELLHNDVYEINGNSNGLTAQDVYNEQIKRGVEQQGWPLDYAQSQFHVWIMPDGTSVVGGYDNMFIPFEHHMSSNFTENFPYQGWYQLDGKWYFCRFEYTPADPQPEGEWIEDRSQTWTDNEEELASVYMLEGTYEAERIYLTQTFFNSDEDYEYIVNVNEGFEETNEYYREEWNGPKLYKSINKYTHTTLKRIVNNRGTTIAELKAPAGTYFANSGEYEFGGQLIESNGKRYLAVGAYEMEGDGEYLCVYQISESGSVNQVLAERKVRVSPTTPKQGQQVVVDLGEAASGSASVAVVSASGQKIGSARVKAGERQVSLDTARLAPGLYIVNVTDGSTTREATKIIVR